MFFFRSLSQISFIESLIGKMQSLVLDCPCQVECALLLITLSAAKCGANISQF